MADVTRLRELQLRLNKAAGLTDPELKKIVDTIVQEAGIPLTDYAENPSKFNRMLSPKRNAR